MSTVSALTSDDLGSAAQRDRWKRILDATIELASTGGFDAVQMRSVAERADVALGTLYRYFPSKLHLLVTALSRELEQVAESFDRRPIQGATAHDRVMFVLSRATRSLQRDPYLTEALARAFMFADASVAKEIQVVDLQVSRLLTRAIPDPVLHPTGAEPSETDLAIAKVIGDVWLSSLVQWVTGRASADDVASSIEVAVRLLLP